MQRASRLLFLRRRLSSATSRDALFTATKRKKRFMILVSSLALVFRGPRRPLHFPSFQRETFSEFLANARDRPAKQLFLWITTIQRRYPAAVLLQSNDSDPRTVIFDYEVSYRAFHETVRSKRYNENCSVILPW